MKKFLFNTLLIISSFFVNFSNAGALDSIFPNWGHIPIGKLPEKIVDKVEPEVESKLSWYDNVQDAAIPASAFCAGAICAFLATKRPANLLKKINELRLLKDSKVISNNKVIVIEGVCKEVPARLEGVNYNQTFIDSVIAQIISESGSIKDISKKDALTLMYLVA